MVRNLLLSSMLVVFLVTGVSASSMNKEIQGAVKSSPKEAVVQPIEDLDAKTEVVALAVVVGTQEGSSIEGKVVLTETTQGLQIMAFLDNVTPSGKHGFHIHEKGSCEENGKAAGGHFNPKSVAHGLLAKDGSEKAHVGDMGNIEIDESGSGMLNVFLPGVKLTGEENNVIGRAIILHAQEDDYGQPTGNAGARIGCGVIEISSEEE